jgi:hypothetical protein
MCREINPREILVEMEGGDMVQSKTTSIYTVRDLAVLIARHQPVSDADAEGARGAIRSICKEASLHGLTTAEVLRAIFRPVLETRSRGCGCPACRARQERQSVGERLETVGLDHQPPSAVV